MVLIASDAGELETFTRAHPQVRYVDVFLADLLGVARGKRLPIDTLASVYAGGFRLPGSMFALDVLGNTVEATRLGFDDGDADRSCLPIEGSLVPVPWLSDGVAQVQVSMIDHDGRPFFGDPRQVLAQIVGRFTALELRPVLAIELEFYVVDPQRTLDGGVRPPASPWGGAPRPGKQINSMERVMELSAVLGEICRACEAQGVPATSVLAESGPGQYEVNLHHVADPCVACDHAIRLKRIVRGVFLSHGLCATFMPKPYANEAGSGAHIHVSLLDAAGRNIFSSPDRGGSRALAYAIGGLAATMSEAMLVFAPTANAYRRFRPESYVPLAPTWGVNNRGVALRVPADSPENQRVEHRVAGADANPYLLASIVLAGIHHGLVNQLDPGAPFAGNAYREGVVSLPVHWREAIAQFERSAFVREYLGAAFQQLYATSRRFELAAFDGHVSRLDFDWYLTAG